MKVVILITLILLIATVASVQAQTSSFTYQGKMADGGVAANGTYDITFKLYDSPVNGTQIGTDIFRDNVVVDDGIFSVDLDFGAAGFANGDPRFLQLEVRPGASSGAFTALFPRQPVTSSPYGIKTINATAADSLSAACISCVTDANINSVSASKVTGVLTQTNGGTGLSASGAAGNFLRSDGTNWTSSPLQASDVSILGTSFIQNTTATQAASNFNISGTGSADILNAATQYNLGGSRLIATSQLSNLFAGIGAGQANPTGSNNSFVGYNSGQSTVTGNSNSFFGNRTGQNNLASNNSFFGHQAGFSNITGGSNTFLGSFAGTLNTSGSYNSFVGQDAGNNNGIGEQNTFLGDAAGFYNTEGSYNTFVGVSSGNSNTVGSRNTTLGFFANVAAPDLTYATAIGADATVSSSNTLVLGRALDTVRVPGNLNVAGSFTGNFTISASNITTGVLSQANGGTGVTSPGTAGNFLRSDGTNWTSSPFQASDIPVLSTSFIQNIAIGQQSGSFNIDGGGNANIFNAATQYNLGGSRILSNVGNNLFVGLNTGPNNGGFNNSFAGNNAGAANTAGYQNTFFGANAGSANTFGLSNSFFGMAAGEANDSGSENSFFGVGAGATNNLGTNNVFFGRNAGITNTTGSENTIVGSIANVLVNNLTNANAFGYRAAVGASNSLILGSINGVNGATANTKVGIGTTTPAFRLDVADRVRIKQNPADTGSANSAGLWLFQNAPNTERAFFGMETDNSVGLFGNNGGGWSLVMNTQTGVVTLRNLGSAGGLALCRNALNEIANCSSSLRYKTNISRFSEGMSFVNQLRPISFDWRDGGMKDVGFGAEDIAKIDPRFVTFNDKGEVEGVKYDRLSVAFVNAFKEQQDQIEAQAKQIKQQQAEIEALRVKVSEVEALKQLVCSQNSKAEVCKPKQ